MIQGHGELGGVMQAALAAAGMLRHLHSLRLMRLDKGWIHTLLEEAENERMHLLTFMQLRQPGARGRLQGRGHPVVSYLHF